MNAGYKEAPSLGQNPARIRSPGGPRIAKETE